MFRHDNNEFLKKYWSFDGTCCLIQHIRLTFGKQASTRSLFQNFLNRVTLNSDEALNQGLLQLFTNKDRTYYGQEIINLIKSRQRNPSPCFRIQEGLAMSFREGGDNFLRNREKQQ